MSTRSMELLYLKYSYTHDLNVLNDFEAIMGKNQIL